MPATEQTWRNVKQLHVWFAVTSLLMLIATAWMFVRDHARPWKVYQRAGRTIEQRLTTWNLRQTQSDARQREQAEITQQLDSALSTPPEMHLVESFRGLIESHGRDQDSLGPIDAAVQAMNDDPSAERFGKLVGLLQDVVDTAQAREKQLASRRKFRAADFDAARGSYNLGVRDEKPASTQDELLQESLAIRHEVYGLDGDPDNLSLTEQLQQAEAYRVALQNILGQIRAEPARLEKALTDAQADAIRLAGTLDAQTSTYFTSSPPFLGKRWLELPILDAFNSPLKIDNLWTEGLETRLGSFGTVRRFDRCTTCHKSIEKTLPGAPTVGAFMAMRELTLRLTVPAPFESLSDDDGDSATGSIDAVKDRFGIELAQRGLVRDHDVTVQFIAPESSAAMAEVVGSESDAESPPLNGLRLGDVITRINGDKIIRRDQVALFLNNEVEEETTIDVTVRRGLPHPFASHPRLDLFVGSLSPHAMAIYGCTVCHEGQGSGTEFKWASHTPNSPAQGERWFSEHGWFNNHHWIEPMFPKRFAESACLKCHHQVVDLRPSERFPDPPAPKLMEGYDLITSHGCFGCHEINGYRGDTPVGPDLRLEPNYYAAAAQLKVDPAYDELDDQYRGWIDTVAHHPDETTARRALHQMIKDDAQLDAPVLSPESHALGDLLNDVDLPGKLRKVGPTLRHIGDKVGPSFLYDWIRDPTHFRPTTKMPRFFGLWDHLDDAGRADAERYEPLEILGTVRYLLAKSQPYDAAYEPPEEGWDDEAVERGTRAFELRGCLACHSHRDFPEGSADHGPDLTNIGDKFGSPDTPAARTWIYNWLKDPSNYHVRTKMPNLQLTPQENADGDLIDPAADIAAFLLASTRSWQPHTDTARRLEVDEADVSTVDQLVAEYLNKVYFRLEVEQFLRQGVPADRARGAELELVSESGSVTTDQKLVYIGQKTIAKYGCYGCHDIPGFETAKPIGAALAEWGRKESSKIAFEHIAEYLHHAHGGGGHTGHTEHTEEAHTESDDHDDDSEESSEVADDHSHDVGPGHDAEIDESFYVEKLHEHDRIGFLWQKLKAPRSYDFKMTANKDYNERLRMPQFPFDPQEREAVATFVLGLLADPPAEQFVHTPTPRKQAIVDGHRVLEKYNCAGCHILRPERWEVEYAEGDLEPPPVEPSYPFVDAKFTSDTLAAAQTIDPLRGTLHATLYGMPEVSSETGQFLVTDEEEEPLEPEDLEEYDPASLILRLQLWEPTILNGEPANVSPTAMSVPTPMLRKRYPAWGGDLTLQLLPKVTEYEKETNPAARGNEAWAWLPPPLLGEGTKVQGDWLHDFLLDPHTIRPATVMRMPKFNMSSDEASALVNFFAVQDDGDFPYTFAARRREGHMQQAEAAYRQRVAELPDGERPTGESRLHDAMNVVVNNNYCIKCHLVGDFVPNALPSAKAPNLANVYKRLQPDYLRSWIAEPRRIQPYTAMPVNIPYSADAPHEGGINQKLYHGTSIDQVDGLVDLLMNFDQYNQNELNYTELVNENAPATPTDDSQAVAPLPSEEIKSGG